MRISVVAAVMSIGMTAAADVLPGIRESAKAWLSELRSRWPDAPPLGLYPAFLPKYALSGDDPASTEQSRPLR